MNYNVQTKRETMRDNVVKFTTFHAMLKMAIHNVVVSELEKQQNNDFTFEKKSNTKIVYTDEQLKEHCRQLENCRLNNIKNNVHVTIKNISSGTYSDVELVKRNKHNLTDRKLDYGKLNTTSDYYYNKIYGYCVKRLRYNFDDGALTIDYCANILYEKFIELCKKDTCKDNALKHLFCIVNKILRAHAFIQGANYCAMNKEVNTLVNDSQYEHKTFTMDYDTPIDTLNNFGKSVKNFTLLELCTQWENSSNRTRAKYERYFYSYFDDNGAMHSEIDTMQDNRSVSQFDSLIMASAKNIVDTIKEKSGDSTMNRIKNIIMGESVENKDKKYLSTWKKQHKISELSRDDIYYLFFMA